MQNLSSPELTTEMSKLSKGKVGTAFQKAIKSVKKAMLLQKWFETVLAVQCGATEGTQAPSLEKPAKPNPNSLKPGHALGALCNSKPNVLLGVEDEEPSPLARILLLEKGWLDKVLAGEKWIEIRKSRISTSKEDETFYLGHQDWIYARCDISYGVKIENQDQFDKLKDGHQWTDPNPPYAYPFFVHLLSKVQRLKPIQFLRVWGSIGRALYRPLDWVEKQTEEGEAKDVGEVGEDGKGSSSASKSKLSSSASKTSKAKQDEKSTSGSKAEQAKQTKAIKKGKAKAKAKHGNPIKCLPPTMLEGQKVETIDPSKHLQPNSERLAAKRQQLQRKHDMENADVHISGGALGHLNNIAFPRGSCMTAAYLLGELDKNKAACIQAMWVPGWEAQTEMEKWTLDNTDLDLWRNNFKPPLQVLGLCLVVPEHEKPAISTLMAFDGILKATPPETLVFGLVGNDRKCTMHHITAEDEAKELQLEVHWVGNASLYRTHVVAEHLQLFERLQEEAIKSVQSKSIMKSSKERKQEQNAKRRAVPADSTEPTHLTAVENLQNIAKQLQHVADFILENLASFDNVNTDHTVSDKYAACLASYPLAEFELSKVINKVTKCPAGVAEAGQRMAATLQLKSNLELRLARRQQNTSHTYDGFKHLKRTCSSQGSSGRTSKRVRSDGSFSTPPSRTSSSYGGASED